MDVYKILNLYACLGGNRYKWDEVARESGIEIQVTAVELDPELARLYQERFPNDIVVVADAHQYLLDHYKEFDFIWSSPPCPTHSKMKKSQTNNGNHKPEYPSMMLYEEILFLSHFFKGKYCVENVIPYYEPLIEAQKRGRHLYWCNFKLPDSLNDRRVENFIHTKLDNLSKFHEFDFKILLNCSRFTQSGNKPGIRIEKIARNLVDYEAGKTIFECVLEKAPVFKINSLFDNEYMILED
ncbi:DNA cytosine methyltransferase [Chryseobacterium sp. PCH239]|uniref:DNA cytosine methyltransferase n=1 Tax=Chryseobacterium sp. PCH239 TaxID=2825845 RepID=UPI001C12288A|nr:DNA cytosine methyltransferase [Chryseobacterium sp. PCH239]QWT88145.1 DNA cytosine methyltransferase [Chryseobacterium sp. PCH239]